MKKRRKLSKGKSRKLFRNTAQKTKRANVTMRPLRGGGRL